MFVIQLDSGQTRGYNTVEELRAAIRRGELGPSSQVYHRAGDRWLPLSVHPVYRRVEAERLELSVKTLQRRHWTFLPREAEESDPEQAAGSADAAPVSPTAAGEPTQAKPGWVRSTLRRLRLRAQPASEQS